MIDTRDYIERTYKQAIREYQAARTDDDRWEARKEMARLERLAGELYGFEYADSVHGLLKGVIA